MDQDQTLDLNIRKILRCLKGVLPADAVQAVEAVIHRHARRLAKLGRVHLRHARQSAGPQAWRQRLSRSYYACYSFSKAVRYFVDGNYSADVTDHKKVGDLPNDFPECDIWKNLLVQFRGDRNVADYDHNAKERQCEHTSTQYLEQAAQFCATAGRYLRQKGLKI